MEDFFSLLSPLLFVLIGGGIGKVQERRHEQSLRRREAALRGFVVTDMARIPGAPNPVVGTLVAGEVVVASDYGKRFVASLRQVIGGEVRSYRRMTDRARREALLRAIAEAQSRGATALVNVRFDTSMVAANAAEVLCSGTAVR